MFSCLEKIKIIKSKPIEKEQKSNLKVLFNKLNIIQEEVDAFNPKDISYVYNGYRPLLIALVQEIFNKGFKKTKEIVSKIEGYETSNFIFDEKKFLNPISKSNNLVILLFIGGVTYAEIAAIRLLERNLKTHRFVIVTTSIINGCSFLEAISPKEYAYESFK